MVSIYSSIYSVEVRLEGRTIKTVSRVVREHRDNGSQSVRYNGARYQLYEGPNPGVFFIEVGTERAEPWKA